MQKKSQIITGIFVSAAVILVVSYQATTSLDPTEVFRDRDPIPKVVIGFFALMLALGLIALLMRNKLDDLYCAGTRCGFPLLDFAAVYGDPVRCVFCGRWFHKTCYKASGGTLLGGCLQSPCPSVEAQMRSRKVDANVWAHPRTF